MPDRPAFPVPALSSLPRGRTRKSGQFFRLCTLASGPLERSPARSTRVHLLSENFSVDCVKMGRFLFEKLKVDSRFAAMINDRSR